MVVKELTEEHKKGRGSEKAAEEEGMDREPFIRLNVGQTNESENVTEVEEVHEVHACFVSD